MLWSNNNNNKNNKKEKKIINKYGHIPAYPIYKLGFKGVHNYWRCFNPYLAIGFSHLYHLGEPTVNLRDFRSDYEIFFIFSMKFL